jgi:hypothetical protein
VLIKEVFDHTLQALRGFVQPYFSPDPMTGSIAVTNG